MENAIYHKTALGQQELTQRGGLIGQKERQVLFMIDGARHSMALAGMLPNIDVLGIVHKLYSLGFISAVSQSKTIDQIQFSGPTTVAPQISQDLLQKRQIDAARQVILAVTQEYLGKNWEDRLSELLSTVRRPEDFAPIVEQWGVALRRSGYRSAADLGEREVKAVFAS
ncbi:hypothetical protein [Deefgea rivuli]|uniref:hypothetical protein n=1 Tax=Deefgea rivuli TaxID=400948 RepID=UPI000481C11D|nr:hypothetical protein [Deefgea rivuli]